MKTLLSTAVLAALAAGQAQATCTLFPETLFNNTHAQLVVETPVVDLTAPPWLPDQVYQAGDSVQHQLVNYQARWWTQNEEPGPSWVSWQKIMQQNAVWDATAVYKQGDTVLFEGVIYQAEYWNQQTTPGASGAWSHHPVTQKMRSAFFIRSGYSCARPPSDFGGNYWEVSGSNSLKMMPIITDEVIFDYVIIERDEEISSEPIRASIGGVSCEGQMACNALLDGVAKQVDYYNGYSYSYTESHGSKEPTPEPTPLPVNPALASSAFELVNAENQKRPDVVVKFCNQQHVCLPISF
ncbi:hypothetical protein K6Y31_08770 [Motilimonas cestriensis]|uniref:Chitin-binding type-3 domain-containing protein n=1 Tax=Motilimonas cestriensis TaxID=2742685 RepID=A0ABS8WAY2_9GAMM|nr:carbohydrate-binding protein [Motilimonas cestriensis]MCE2594906.1 hypothetical protein [Motilimonas cestriensis]